jgi:hypothetical protein
MSHVPALTLLLFQHIWVMTPQLKVDDCGLIFGSGRQFRCPSTRLSNGYRLMRTNRQAKHSPPPNADVYNRWSFTSTPLYTSIGVRNLPTVMICRYFGHLRWPFVLLLYIREFPVTGEGWARIKSSSLSKQRDFLLQSETTSFRWAVAKLRQGESFMEDEGERWAERDPLSCSVKMRRRCFPQESSALVRHIRFVIRAQCLTSLGTVTALPSERIKLPSSCFYCFGEGSKPINVYCVHWRFGRVHDYSKISSMCVRGSLLCLLCANWAPGKSCLPSFGPSAYFISRFFLIPAMWGLNYQSWGNEHCNSQTATRMSLPEVSGSKPCKENGCLNRISSWISSGRRGKLWDSALNSPTSLHASSSFRIALPLDDIWTEQLNKCPEMK